MVEEPYYPPYQEEPSVWTGLEAGESIISKIVKEI